MQRRRRQAYGARQPDRHAARHSGEGLAHIVVGGAEYYANVDPRVPSGDLKIGTQFLVNEAYAVIKTLGYDRNGPFLKLTEAMADGRLRFEQEMGRQSLILQRSSDLAGVELKAGDEVRIDPSSSDRHREARRIARRTKHVLDEAPNVTWEQIGGQKESDRGDSKGDRVSVAACRHLRAVSSSPNPRDFSSTALPGAAKH